MVDHNWPQACSNNFLSKIKTDEILIINKIMKINLAFTYALLMLLCCAVFAARKKAEKNPRFQYNNQVAAKSVLRDDSTDSIETSLMEARRVTEMYPDIAQGWANLGILLQSKDLTSHNGGALRVEALGAFEKVSQLIVCVYLFFP